MSSDPEIHQEAGNTLRFHIRKIVRALFLGSAILAVLVGAAYLGIYFYQDNNPSPDPLSQNDVDEIVGDALASAPPPEAISAQVYQFILPSLVLIQTQIENPENENSTGLGSGVVVNAMGDVLTALHVVDEARQIEVMFADGTRANAEIVSTDPAIDIAVLHPDRLPELIVPAILGNPNAMRTGDEAYAAGNPLGLPASMSAGVISGFNRIVTVDESGRTLAGLIQFDAAVNPGNSGGPLLNRYGQVIGIVTGLANPTEQNYFIGVGFAVPITVAGGAAGLPPH